MQINTTKAAKIPKKLALIPNGNATLIVSRPTVVVPPTIMEANAAVELTRFQNNKPKTGTNNPETIKLMTYYVKFNESSSEIYLLNAPKFSSNAIDLDIYLIKKQLEKKGISSRILFDEKYWKSIIKGIGNRQSKVIHYGIKEKNFVLIQHGKEDLVFENRKKVIDYIVNSMI